VSSGMAAAPAAASAPATAPAETTAGTPPSIHVTYVPELVREQIASEVKQQVMQQAQQEGWAEPHSQPEWTQRIKIFGDIRIRGEEDMLSGNNCNCFTDYNTINGSANGYDVNSTPFPPTLNMNED